MFVLTNRVIYFLVLFSVFNKSSAHYTNDSVPNFKARKIFLLGTTGLLSGTSVAYLSHVWYSKYNTSKFHYFDDSEEWMQMDKCGHMLTNFQMSQLMMKSFKWSGFNKRQTLLIGGTIGFSYMTAIEVMDGYSKGWGFSWTDVGANTLGSGIAMMQEVMWKEQRINIKFSFHRTGHAQYNPELLGDDLGSELLKNYNGQAYWLSVSPLCFIKSDRKLPRWLAISFGYGADGMLGANYNNIAVVDDEGNVTEFNRQRQYYLSFDVDLSKIKTRYKFLQAVFNAVNIIKIPAPTLEFQNGKTNFYYFYF